MKVYNGKNKTKPTTPSPKKFKQTQKHHVKNRDFMVAKYILNK